MSVYSLASNWSPQSLMLFSSPPFQIAFRAQNFLLAADKYRAALRLVPRSAVLYSNLSASIAADPYGDLHSAIQAGEIAIEVCYPRRTIFPSCNLNKAFGHSSIQNGIVHMSDWFLYTKS